MKFGEIAAMEDRVQKGAWVKPPSFQGVALQVRGIGNADYQRAQMKAMSDLKPDESIPPPVVAKMLADHVLLGWSGIEDKDYSSEAAIEALQATVFQNAVIWCATQVAQQGKKSLGDLTGN